jgi:hypothetical protein
MMSSTEIQTISALSDAELDAVAAAGGFNYNPQWASYNYAHAVQKNFGANISLVNLYSTQANQQSNNNNAGNQS